GRGSRPRPPGITLYRALDPRTRSERVEEPVASHASGARAALLALAGLLLLIAGAATYVDPDVWHLMALARAAIALGHMPVEDLFAYPPTVRPVVQHEWGSGVVLYGLATHGGVGAFQIARLALLVFSAVVCTRVAVRRGATLGALSLLALPAIVMSWIGLTA